MVTACNRGYDNHFIGLSHWNTTLQAQSYDIPPGHIIPSKVSTSFCVELPFLCRAFDKGLQLPLKSLVWPGIDPRTSQTQSEYSTTRLLCYGLPLKTDRTVSHNYKADVLFPHTQKNNWNLMINLMPGKTLIS